MLIEKGLRGRISHIAKRYAKANYKHMKNYDLTKPSKCISCLHKNNLYGHISMDLSNNLYGWKISGYLPYGGFKWLKNVDNFNINSIGENRLIGYILEVDLEYPHELHVLHNNYPLAPEKLAIPHDMFPDY